jgi:hypothetical protein
MNKSTALATAALALAAAAPTLAATATLTHRESVSHIVLTAGYGPAQIQFSDGSLTPQTSSSPGTLWLSGSDSGYTRYAAYEATFNTSWDQHQDYSFQTLGSDAVLQASGSLGVVMSSTWFNNVSGIGGSPTTQYYTSTNWQAFEFELDESTAFTFSGSTVDGQSLQMYRWFNDNWVTAAYVISPGAGTDIFNTGVIDAGRYLLRNTPVPYTRVTTAVTGNGWDYTLTLHNTVAAVPEPATVLSMLAGLGLMGWQLRRRRAA